MATYTGIKEILKEFKNRMIKTKVNNAAQADTATNADKVDGYHVGTSYPALVPVTACSLGSTSGYIKLGNGLLVQWIKTGSGDSNLSVTLPIAYSSRTSYFAFVTSGVSDCETRTTKEDSDGYDYTPGIDQKYANRIVLSKTKGTICFILCIGT